MGSERLFFQHPKGPSMKELQPPPCPLLVCTGSLSKNPSFWQIRSSWTLDRIVMDPPSILLFNEVQKIDPSTHFNGTWNAVVGQHWGHHFGFHNGHSISNAWWNDDCVGLVDVCHAHLTWLFFICCHCYYVSTVAHCACKGCTPVMHMQCTCAYFLAAWSRPCWSRSVGLIVNLRLLDSCKKMQACTIVWWLVHTTHCGPSEPIVEQECWMPLLTCFSFLRARIFADADPWTQLGHSIQFSLQASDCLWLVPRVNGMSWRVEKMAISLWWCYCCWCCGFC